MSPHKNILEQRHRSRFRLPRILTSLLMMAAIAWAFATLAYPLPGQSRVLEHFSRLDPFTALAVWLRQGEIQAWFAAGLGLLAASLLFGRFFCTWLCPFGAILIIIDELRLASRSWRHRKALVSSRPAPFYTFLNQYRYVILGTVLLLIFMGSYWPLQLIPSSLMGHEMERLLEGRAPFWLLSIVILGLLTFPRFWCTYLCPTGLLLQAAGRWRRWGFQLGARCNRCGLCVPYCPVAAIDLETGHINESCTLCGACYDACHRSGVNFGRLEPENIPAEPAPTAPSPARRSLLQLIGAGLLCLPLAALFKPGQPARAAYLRPPGALSESLFMDTCIRCHRCIKVCPTGTLRPLGLEYGLRAFDSPALFPELARCELDLLCQEVCPVNAIQTVPIEEVKIGQAVLDRELCLNWGQGKLCLLCLEQCPVQAIYKDSLKRPYVDEALCTGCGSCEFGCPARPRAIIVMGIGS